MPVALVLLLSASTPVEDDPSAQTGRVVTLLAAAPTAALVGYAVPTLGWVGLMLAAGPDATNYVLMPLGALAVPVAGAACAAIAAGATAAIVGDDVRLLALAVAPPLGAAVGFALGYGAYAMANVVGAPFVGGLGVYTQVYAVVVGAGLGAIVGAAAAAAGAGTWMLLGAASSD